MAAARAEHERVLRERIENHHRSPTVGRVAPSVRKTSNLMKMDVEEAAHLALDAAGGLLRRGFENDEARSLRG